MLSLPTLHCHGCELCTEGARPASIMAARMVSRLGKCALMGRVPQGGSGTWGGSDLSVPEPDRAAEGIKTRTLVTEVSTYAVALALPRHDHRHARRLHDR